MTGSKHRNPIQRTWFTIAPFSGVSLLLLASCWSSIVVTAEDTVIHDRQQQRSQQRRKRMREDGLSTHKESSSSESFYGSESVIRSMVECATPYSRSKDYEEGDIVSRKGKMYQCKPHPYSLWCSNGSYAPGGATGYWSEAWILLNSGEKCEGVPVSTIIITPKTEISQYAAKKDKPVAEEEDSSEKKSHDKSDSADNTAIQDRPITSNIGKLKQLPQCAPSFKLGNYYAGELASKKNKNYKCKNYPYTKWCGLEAYAPDSGQLSAWIPLGDCTKESAIQVTSIKVKPPTKRPTRNRPSNVSSHGDAKPKRPSTTKQCAPKFNEKTSYVRNQKMSWRGKNYRCSVSRRCNIPKFQPTHDKYWKLVWYPIGSCRNNNSSQNERPTRPTASRPANKPNKPNISSSQSSPAQKPKPKPPMTPSSSGNTISTQNERPTQPSASKPANKPNKPFASSPQVNPAPKPNPNPATPVSTGNSSSANNNLTAKRVFEVLESKSGLIDDKLFLYQGSTPSEVYRYKGFIDGLRVMSEVGVAGKKFYLGSDSQNGYLYGLVNIAAFLGQSMKETIQYDACDENSWDLIDMKYPLSNACGQLGQSYQEYHCAENEKHMECKVDPKMSIQGTTHAKWYGAPGPMFCGPKTEYPFTGYWDYNYQCNNPWANPPQYCTDYEGQKAGRADNTNPVANRSGRTDVEGCCWWGRGVIQTTGICNFGKLNYFLGKRAHDEGRDSRYPEIDFCKDPQIICSSEEHKELKWIAGMFYWIESLQSYEKDGWTYMKALHEYVDNGMVDNSFIDAVSGIVNRGCHNPPCAAGPVDGGFERSENFKKVLSTINS